MDSYEHAGWRFDVRDSGPTQGEAVVCLHGFPQDGSAFDQVVPILVEAGYRVLVPDQRGYSPAARPAGRRAYILPELVADVLALLDAADVRSAHVVGHDWGGVVGWALAGQHPERVRSLTVLSAPHPTAVSAAIWRSAQAVHLAHIALFQLPWLPEAVLLAGRGRGLRLLLVRSGLPKQAADRYVERMRQPQALTCALAWYRALPLWDGYQVGRVLTPTTFVWGSRDPAITARAARLTADYVDAPFQFIELNSGHWLPDTEPHAVAAAVKGVMAMARSRGPAP
jgi:pimeloyl-ACP methyl ester carboxylesterase